MLPEWHAGETPIVALFPDRVTMPRKTRVFLDAMIDAMARLQGTEPNPGVDAHADPSR